MWRFPRWRRRLFCGRDRRYGQAYNFRWRARHTRSLHPLRHILSIRRGAGEYRLIFEQGSDGRRSRQARCFGPGFVYSFINVVGLYRCVRQGCFSRVERDKVSFRIYAGKFDGGSHGLRLACLLAAGRSWAYTRRGKGNNP